MALLESSDLQPVRLGCVEGYLGKKNEIIFHPSSSETPEAYIIFFGGDVQVIKQHIHYCRYLYSSDMFKEAHY